MKQVTHTVNKIKNRSGMGGGRIILLLVLGSLLLPFVFVIISTLPYYLLIFFTICGYIIYRIFRKRTPKIAKYTNLSLSKESDKLNINNYLTIENPYAGVFISGGAGSGKSKSIIEPLIKNAGGNNFTGVVYDYKFPELAEYVNTAYKNSTVSKYFVNFTNVNKSHRINPIAPELMKNDSFAREFAFSILANLNPQIIKNTDFWTDNSLALLSSVFWYLKTTHPKYCTLPHAISLILQPDLDALLEKLKTNSKCSDMIATILTAQMQGATNQLSGVISSLQVSLSKINTSEIYYILSNNDFSLNLNDPENPAILTIGNDPTLANTYSPIIGLILTSLSKQLNQQNKEKSIFMIDEFPTVFVPNIEQLPATGRSNKISTILACQDIAQVVDRYGKSKADTILSNLGNQFFGRTTNPETAQRVSSMFGKGDKLIQTVGTSFQDKILYDKRAGRSESYTYQERDLVKAQDVAQLQTGSFFTIVSEGNVKQGKATISIDSNFTKTSLPFIRDLKEEHLDICFENIKQEAKDILNG
jgi:type IV secretory pathway TraG/TraD family ATPase VirD4